MNSPVYHAEAEVTFLRPEEGGRATPIRSGYRPNFYYDGAYWDSIHAYPDTDAVKPGETVRVLLWFTNPDAHRENLYPGKRFEVREGPHIVGHGRITKIFGLE